ncbi:hypothetical protein GCM10028819_32770 [Spirosoma humi]
MKSKYRLIAFVLALVIINGLAFSIALVDKTSYKNALFYRFTRQRFAWIVSSPPPQHAINAGWAKASLNAAFSTTKSAQTGLSPADSIFTRAIVFDNGTTKAALISIDLLMMPPLVAIELQKRLPKLGFDWKNVYLGATNSHQNLGGWANDYMSRKSLGDYDEMVVDNLTKAILQAVATAQKNSAVVQTGYAQAENAHFLKIQKGSGESAIIFSTNAPQLFADLTDSSTQRTAGSLLATQLEKSTGSFLLYLAGGVDPPNTTAPAGQADSLLARVTPVLKSLPLHTDSVLVAQTVPLIQSDPQVRISKSWRLKPWLVKAIYGDYGADMKALRIGKTVFVGNPGAFSSALALALQATPTGERNNLVITSYNGGMIGQIVPDSYYYDPQSPYDIRDMNRFGPHTSAFITEMVQNLVSSLK